MLAAVAAVAACGTSSSRAASRPSPTGTELAAPSTPPTSSATTASPFPSAIASGKFRQAYLNGFEDFFLAYARADESADSTSPTLAQTATGEALAWARMQVTDHKKLGVAHAGEWRFRNVGATDVTSSSALVGQCMDWSSWPVVNRVTGAKFQQFAPWSQLLYAKMVLVAGHWKATTVRVQAAAC